MVEISMSGSGEGPVWATGRGYSTCEDDTPNDMKIQQKNDQMFN